MTFRDWVLAEISKMDNKELSEFIGETRFAEPLDKVLCKQCRDKNKGECPMDGLGCPETLESILGQEYKTI